MLKGLKSLFGSQEKHVILSPVAGKAIPMSQVNDPTFSQEILGKGVAIIPSEGEVKAPADGTVSMIFDTKHAVSMTADNGAEIIIHIGLDTVELKGEHFTALAEAGQKVKAGTPLVRFDMEKIKEAGYDVVTPVIVCNTPQFPDMVCKTGMDVKAGDVIIELD
ncbi:MAG TPA: PTS glucose transporter subunit IIA [Candidatus Enterocloster faecavium]|uniref:PTS glucose transporter subunit IIA n=1 Tax=Candidatus Enterocloster faecavium TaxID=2838560 RepID=A0A9D2RLN6_9FIRM|nr:PTS glucose transporter subunit IIA [Candidatus Enterocloster faecavium]